jgi:hypothetical protein
VSSARTPLPTDIVALVSFDGRVYPNEAKPLDHLGSGERTHPLESALEQWFSFATGKHAWVSVRGATIRGLISARRRAKRSAWEVETLIDVDNDAGVVSSLFSRMIAGITPLGAERVFLRLEDDSPLIDAARSSGFFAYQRETLYRCARVSAPPATDRGLRPRRKEDALGLFHLYSQSVPASVRAIEGLTLREWQAAHEAWGKRPKDLVLEEDASIIGWLRFSHGHPARLAALGSGAVLEALVSLALHRLHDNDGPALALVPDHCSGLARLLEERGFEPAGRYATLARRLIKPVGEFAAEPVQTPVPVR